MSLIQNIFSIGITTIKLDNIDNDLLINYAKNKFKSDVKNTNYKSDDIELKELTPSVLYWSNKVFEQILGYPKDLYIKRVWGNVNVDRTIGAPHKHRDSILSAVYYPKCEDGQLVFMNPQEHPKLLSIPHNKDRLIKKYNEYNSELYELNVFTGMLVIFNANLNHYVLSSTKERISIAMDLDLND